jgi:UDP:flavonoid glycosyltransferase YjiC (YdhE family)
MTCQPAFSHVAQLVPLAHALRDRGHDVTLATSGPYSTTLRQQGLAAEPVGPDFLLREGDPTYEATVGSRLFFGFIDLARRATVDDIVSLGRAREVDLVIREYAEFGGWIAAQRLGIPVVTQGIMHRLPPPAVQRILADLEAPAREAGVDPPSSERELYGDAYLDVVPASFRMPWESDAPFVLPSAPSQFEGASEADGDEFLATLGAGRPLVYVTLGTLFTHDAEVWRTVLEAVAEFDADVLMTIGFDTDEALIGATPENVVVKRFVPQSQVLPRCAAVVCHAGFNTLLGAFRAGVPSVCLPLNADQPLNAAACAAAGAGLNVANSAGDTRGAIVDPGSLAPADVRAAIETVLNDGSFRNQARRLGEEIRNMPSHEHVAEAIELCVEHAGSDRTAITRNTRSSHQRADGLTAPFGQSRHSTDQELESVVPRSAGPADLDPDDADRLELS